MAVGVRDDTVFVCNIRVIRTIARLTYACEHRVNDRRHFRLSPGAHRNVFI